MYRIRAGFFVNLHQIKKKYMSPYKETYIIVITETNKIIHIHYGQEF